jgi:hypothetical protein
MNLHYDHPILLLQHMLWHEGDSDARLAARTDRPATRQSAS